VTVWETVFVFVVLPLAGFGLLALLVYGPAMTRTSRYRPGRPWEHDPVWYVARPESGAPVPSGTGRAELEAAADRRALPGGPPAGQQPPASVLDVPARTARGGASGEW
jgi:hypothetical protein